MMDLLNNFVRGVFAPLPAEPPRLAHTAPCVSPAGIGRYYAHGPYGVCGKLYPTIEAAQARADRMFEQRKET